MNDQTPIASTELVEVRTLVPADVFGPGGAEAIIKQLTDKVLAVATDISTPTGRKAVASLAYKVARSKTALDEMGKELAAEWKARVNAIDAERRTIRDKLDALQEQVRKPLTDWENVEKARVKAHQEALIGLANLAVFAWDASVAEINERIAAARLAHEGREWQEFEKRADETVESTLSALKALRVEMERREAERAEQERLRREQAEREQHEREERIAQEAAERARLAAEREARAQAEAVERANRLIAENAAREKAAAEQAAREAEQRALRAEAEKTAAEQRAKEEAEAAARRAEQERVAAAEKAERERLAAIEAERKRVADEQAAAEAERKRREADRAHRAKINGAARDALVKEGLSADVAVNVLSAIIRGDIPHVRIDY